MSSTSVNTPKNDIVVEAVAPKTKPKRKRIRKPRKRVRLGMYKPRSTLTPEKLAKNREYQREYYKAYYAKNKERLCEKQRLRYATDPDYRSKIRLRQRKTPPQKA